jgi:hypothetical protein
MERNVYCEPIPFNPESTVWVESDKLQSKDWFLLSCIDVIHTKKRGFNSQSYNTRRKLNVIGIIHSNDLWYAMERKHDKESQIPFTIYGFEIKKDIKLLQTRDFTLDIFSLKEQPEITNDLELCIESLSISKPLSIWCVEQNEFNNIKQNLLLQKDYLKTYPLRTIALNRMKILKNVMSIKSKIPASKESIEECTGFYFLSNLFCITEELRNWFVRAETIYFLEKIYTIKETKNRRETLIQCGFPINLETTNFSQTIKKVLEDRIYDFLFKLFEKTQTKVISSAIEDLYMECLHIYQSK